MDVGILMDELQSGPSLQKLKLFVQGLVSSFDIASGLVHIGVILYSDTAKVLFNLDKHGDLWSMLEAIENVKPAGGSAASRKSMQLSIGD